jgi:thymidylate synthase ThyX
LDYRAMGMDAALVWDGGAEVRIPPALGEPRPDQMQGTPAERLCELAGRTCYDSLGQGRSSAAYHDHILEVRNHSVYEHFAFTVQFPDLTLADLYIFLNRPGLWVQFGPSVRVTLNLRTVMEWDRRGSIHSQLAGEVGWALTRIGHKLAPRIIRAIPGRVAISAELVEPEHPQEAWSSLYLAGSRGFSHEQVRHGDWTAISQRSTRYVDEGGSRPVTHPLIQQYLDDSGVDEGAKDFLADQMTFAWDDASIAYRGLVAALESYAVARGLDRTSARKQARGAARGYMGNALPTAMIFSASAAQWAWMASQRASRFADAEIRAIYELAIPELKASRIAPHLGYLNLVPSPDGIGNVIEES